MVDILIGKKRKDMSGVKQIMRIALQKHCTVHRFPSLYSQLHGRPSLLYTAPRPVVYKMFYNKRIGG